MSALPVLASAALAMLPCIAPHENEKDSELIQIWRLEKLTEAETVDSAAAEVSSLPRFLIVTENIVFDLLYIDKNGGYTSIHEKVVKSRTARDAKQILLISDLKNGEKFALQLYPSKDYSTLNSTLTARKEGSVFARVARFDYHVASDSDSVEKLQVMLTHDMVANHTKLAAIIESFLLRAEKADEPSDQPKSPRQESIQHGNRN